MKKYRFFCILLLFVLVDNTNGKQFYCKENPTNSYYSSGNVCTISGILPEDALVEIKYQQRSYITKMVIVNSTLDDIPNNMFIGFSNINHLSCINCQLTDLSKYSFNGLPNLLSLNISFGTFTVLQKNLFSQTTQLQFLNASNGNVEEINETAFVNVVKLKILDLNKNNIKKITNKMFQSLINLVTLKLSYNAIEVLDEGLFVNNVNLKYLSLDHNNISIIDSDIFDPNCELNFILLSFNQLSTINTTNIPAKHIFASNNEINDLVIGDTIKFLYLNQNHISNVTCMSDNSQLTTLMLSKNSLKTLGCIGSLTQMTNLDLSLNEVGLLNPNTFAKLTKLDTLNLRSSKISNLGYGVFSHQTNLQHLDISYNFLKNVPLNIFLAATNLKSLFIDGNNLTEFAYHDLKSAFKNFETIGVGENNFNCTFLAEAIKFLNAKDVKTIVSSAEKVTNSHNINGIHCIEKNTPNWIKPNNNVTNKHDLQIHNDEQIKSIIDQISILLEAKDATHDSILQVSEDFRVIKNQVIETKNNILEIKTEILKLELAQTNNMTNSSNTMIWTLINQLNNITLEKQLLNNRVQDQEINNMKFEIEKISHKLNEISTKLSTYISKSSSSGFSDFHSSNDMSLIKNVNIILITILIVICIYKAYQFVKKYSSNIRRYNTQNTIHSSLEMHHN